MTDPTTPADPRNPDLDKVDSTRGASEQTPPPVADPVFSASDPYPAPQEPTAPPAAPTEPPAAPSAPPAYEAPAEQAAPAYAPPPPPAAPAYAPPAASDPYAAPAGAAYTPPAGDPYAVPPGNTYAASAPYQAAGPASKPPVLSIISMIVGILGVIGGGVAFLPVVGPFLQIWFPAAAIVLGFLGKGREPRGKGFWLTGIITGFVGLGILLLGILVTIVFFASSSSYSDY